MNSLPPAMQKQQAIAFENGVVGPVVATMLRGLANSAPVPAPAVGCILAYQLGAALARGVGGNVEAIAAMRASFKDAFARGIDSVPLIKPAPAEAVNGR
jgi:hypothetical protein